jgi:ABC-type amino acid transport substrate-binding protein
MQFSACNIIENVGIQLVDSGYLTVGISTVRPPIYTWEAGKPTGFENDLMQAIADDMGLGLVILPMDDIRTEANQYLAKKTVDIALPHMSFEGMYKPDAIESQPYCRFSFVCLVKDDSSFSSITDLKGRPVGIQANTYVETRALESLQSASIYYYWNENEGLAALDAGWYDAIVIYQRQIDDYISPVNSQAFRVIDAFETTEALRFLVSKNNPALLQAVNESLDRLIDNGTYARIYVKYFGFEPTIE